MKAMNEKFELLFHLILTLAKICRPGGVKGVIAENIAMRQQLITLNRGRRRAPKLTTFDRFLFAYLSKLIGKNRLQKIAVIIKPATILKFHKMLVKKKYSQLYSNKTRKKPGRKPRDQALIDLVIEMKRRNPTFGYGRISMQIYEAFGIIISRFAVGRILRKNMHQLPSGGGPSWLTYIGQIKDSLWSVDMFRCESINLKSHWVMIVMDQFTRRIIGFAVNPGELYGIAICRMFNQIISGKPLPKRLSSDNDPLFDFSRWKANLRVLEIEEIKSVPGVPTSHPFIERLIGTCRREYLDHIHFFSVYDLQHKLDQFQIYYNEIRVHSSLDMKTPMAKASDDENITENVISLDCYRWKSSCGGLYKLPVAA